MRKHGEKWIGNVDGVNHLLMAVGGRKKYQGSLCHGCSFVDDWDDDCTLKVPPCDMDCKIKDLGPVNEDGALPCPFCRKYPEIREAESHVCCHLVSCTAVDRSHRIEVTSVRSIQEAIDAWNQRGGV